MKKEKEPIWIKDIRKLKKRIKELEVENKKLKNRIQELEEPKEVYDW